MNEIDIIKDKGIEPVYVWKTGKTIYPSKKERLVAEAYIRSGNLAECERVLRKEGWKVSWKTCGRWLKRKNVEEWVMEKMEESGVYAGWTRERWYKVMTDHLTGKKRLADGDGYFMNLVAKYKGWDMSGGVNVVNSINITQLDGKY